MLYKMFVFAEKTSAKRYPSPNAQCLAVCRRQVTFALQSQKAVSAYLLNEQRLPFGFARQYASLK